MRIHRVAETARRQVLGDIAMRDPPGAMHAGIGAAGAMHATLGARNRLRRRLQRALHGRVIGLELPAGKRPAVVFDGELVAGHQESRAGGFSGVPRRNSAAFIDALPARCNSVMRIAPSPQAIASRSSSTAPGAPEPLANSHRRILMRACSPSPEISLHAPGNGDRPWMWRSTA